MEMTGSQEVMSFVAMYKIVVDEAVSVSLVGANVKLVPSPTQRYRRHSSVHFGFPAAKRRFSFYSFSHQQQYQLRFFLEMFSKCGIYQKELPNIVRPFLGSRGISGLNINNGKYHQ